MFNLNVTEQQLHTIIAALRFYQTCGMGSPNNRSVWLDDLATNGGDGVTSLDTEGIDTLVHHINNVLPSDTFDIIGLDICVDDGCDGTKVIFIDTPNIPTDGIKGPVIRIYLNDEPIFENPPLPELPF